MNRCKNCKYFQRYTDKNNLNDKLFYMDYEWYEAYIEVGENFGCIHFKQRERR